MASDRVIYDPAVRETLMQDQCEVITVAFGKQNSVAGAVECENESDNIAVLGYAPMYS